MPHLQFELNQSYEGETKQAFASEIRARYSEIMDTDTGHIAISIREMDKDSLTIGRANLDEGICLMNLDVREGRTIEARRNLALTYMEIVKKHFDISLKNQYVTFTQHNGADFHLVEKYLADWAIAEEAFV